jgi:ribonucleoside-triphosphate reductase
VVVAIPTKDSLVEAVEAAGGDPDVVESADDLTLNEMLAFQAMYQMLWADNSVSFTANVDPDRYTASDVAQQITKFGGLLKGATIFPEKSFPQAPYTRITKEEYDSATAKAVSDGVDEECANGSACPIR